MARYYRTQNIPSIELSKEFVRKIIQVLETEHNRLLENQDEDDKYYFFKKFSIRRKDKSVLETDNSQKFLDSDFDKDVDKIDLEVSTKDKEIQVEISTSWGDSNFSATSKDLDDIWVNGIMAKLAQTFDAVKNSYQFWHSKKAYLVYFPISIFLASIWYYLTIRYSPDTNEQVIIVNWLIWGLGFPFTFALIFKWMFPKVQTKQSKQRKVKKIVISIIGIAVTLILSILGSYLYDLIK